MSTIVYGERIGRLGTLSVGCSAIIFDESRQKVLLTRREDNGKWCLPSGHMEVGESAMEACIREVKEETGLSVTITRFVGTYTNPDRLIEYPDGNRFHLVALHYEAKIIGGELTTSNETTDFGYYSLPEMKKLDMLEIHMERIEDSFTGQSQAFMR